MEDGPGSQRAIGRYLLFAELASGGMASVHLARLVGPVGFSRTVAIKRLHPQLARDPDGVSAFLDEARLTARVHHPNVVQTLDVVEMPGELFLVMEYVRGETLSRLLRAVAERGERPPARIVLPIVTGALYGLHAAHEAKNERGEPLGIVHRDVSPQNLIVGVDGVARVLDFGVAKAIDRAQTTSEGQIKGKLSYMPPEQMSAGLVDRRTDVYAAAVVLWEALTARRLFEGDTQGVLIGKILRGEIARPETFAPELPPELCEVVMRGLALDPDKRYLTALEMATALEQFEQATPREVGAWVDANAHEVLARRAALVAEIESSSFTSGSDVVRKSAVAAASAAPQSATKLEARPEPATTTERSLSAVASPPSVVPAGPAEAEPPRSATPRARSPVPYLLGGLAAVILLGAFAYALRGGPASTGSPGSATSATAATPPPPATSAPPTAASPPTASASASAAEPQAPAPSASAAGKPRRPTLVKRDCNPPFRVDADGIRHMKPECF